MGTGYIVVLKLKFRKENESKLINSLVKCYKKHLSDGVEFSIEKEPKTIEDFVSLYLSKDQEPERFIEEKEILKNGNIKLLFKTEFYACYGCHGILIDFFEAMSNYLITGSSMDINDNDRTIYYPKDFKEEE